MLMGTMQPQSRRNGAPPRHCEAHLRGRDCCRCCAAPYPREKLNEGCPMIASAVLRMVRDANELVKADALEEGLTRSS